MSVLATSTWTWIGVALLVGVLLVAIGSALLPREPLERDEVQRAVDRAARKQKREQR